MELSQVQKIFLMAKKSEGLTVRSMGAYEEAVQRFFTFLMDNKVYDIDEVKSHHVRGFLLVLQEKGLKGITRHRYFRTIKTLCLFLLKDDITTTDFIKGVKPPIEEKKPMRIFTPEELHKIFGSFKKDTFCGQRNYAMTLTFFSSGIRLTELLNLRLEDINFQTEFIYINCGKQQKSRTVPMAKTLKKTLREYLKWREEEFSKTIMPWLFLSVSGEKLTRDAVHGAFRALKKSLRIVGEKVNPHTLRHSFATYYLKGNGDIFSLQQILGHTTLTMTRRYVHLSNDDVKIQFLQSNPADHMKWL